MVNPEARDVDIQSDDFPNRFLVVKHQRLTDENLRSHPIRGGETEGWQSFVTILNFSMIYCSLSKVGLQAY